MALTFATSLDSYEGDPVRPFTDTDRVLGYDEPRPAAGLGYTTLEAATSQRFGLDPSFVDADAPDIHSVREGDEYAFGLTESIPGSWDSIHQREVYRNRFELLFEAVTDFTLKAALSAEARGLHAEGVRLATHPNLNGQRATLLHAHGMRVQGFLAANSFELSDYDKSLLGQQ